MRVVPNENKRGEKRKGSALAPESACTSYVCATETKTPGSNNWRKISFLSQWISVHYRQKARRQGGSVCGSRSVWSRLFTHHTQETESYWNQVGMTFK